MRTRARSKETNSVRSVIGIYASDEGESAKAFATLAASHKGKIRLFREAPPDNVSRKPWKSKGPDRYAALRLEGECLIVAEATPSQVPDIVELLQAEGSPAVFVVSEGLPDLPDSDSTEKELQAPPGSAELEDFARKCAARRSQPAKPRPMILSRLRDDEFTLDSARRELAEASRLEHALTAAAEWLLDNGYLLRTQIAEIRRHLPRAHHKILPAGASGDPYIYELARELVKHADHALNESNIKNCLRVYQQVAPLTIAELWSFALMLRMALIAELAHLALAASQKQQLREAAYFWADRLAVGSRRGTEDFGRVLHLLEAEPAAMETYFLTCLAEQLQDEEDALAPLQQWIEGHMKTPLTEVVRMEHTSEAAESISTANAFGSLRAISRIDFSEIFESTSLMEAELRADPSGTYPHSDFVTRDLCRRAVERVSRTSGVGELDVARRAVALAAKGRDARTQQVAYYLLDDGVLQLEAETHARIPFRFGVIRAFRHHATAAYVGGTAGLTLCFAAVAMALAKDAGMRRDWMIVALGLLALFPLSELAAQTVNALVISLLPPEALPTLDFREGIPPEDATLVVIPMMLSNAEVIRREAEKLEVRFLANQQANLFFSLFSDFTDSTTRQAPGDGELLEVAIDGIARLNRRYPGGRFLLFHRDRVWSDSEQRFIGRERKRGKIEELNAFLSGEGPVDILRAGSLPLPMRYVITLDADTQLPPDTARRMIETIAHPLNRVVIDPLTKVRRQGFSIIQPRVSISLPGATATRFTRIFADTSGTDPYCQTVSDAQQDLFGEAIFHGKAIYDLHAFRGILADRFPAETLLSHDLIEGAHAGVGLASQIELFESLPLDYAGYSQRQHRWIRGDWQIAPWIFPRVPSAEGGMVVNPLSLIARWRIFDNLRRSLVPVASLLLLFFGWMFSRAPGVWTLVIGLAVAIPALAPLLDRVARNIQGTAHGWRGAADEVVRAVAMLVFLPHQAWLATDAIVRVYYRRHISRHNLLEWQPAESAGLSDKTGQARR